MRHMRVICAMAPLCGFLVSPVPVLAQVEQETIPLIMLKPQGAGFGANLHKLYAALKKRSTRATSQVLPLTKAEVWTVPKDDVEGVRKAAARYGVAMSKLSATWNHIFRKAPADAKMNDRQKMIVDRAKTSAATTAVGLMAAPPPPMVEYALTKEASTPAPRRRRALRSHSATTRCSQSVARVSKQNPTCALGEASSRPPARQRRSCGGRVGRWLARSNMRAVSFDTPHGGELPPSSR